MERFEIFGRMTAHELAPLIWDLFSVRPESRDLEPYELQTLLWSLRYTEHLEREAAIAGAVEIVLVQASGEAA